MSSDRTEESLFDARFWGLNAGAWTLLACTSAGAVAADLLRSGRPVEPAGLVGFYLAVYTPWFLTTPVVFAWVERLAATARSRRGLLLGFLPLPFLWLAFYAPSQAAILSLFRHGSLAELPATLRSIPLHQWVIDSVYLAALAGVATAGRQVRLARRRERRSSRLAVENAELSARLSDARLQVLRAQLEPHFLMNALNSIAALVRGGRGETAVDAVALLSELLRYATRAVRREQIPLGDELDFAEAYMGFQGLRFGDRLFFHVEAEPSVTFLKVPPLVLQPLLENAVRHGVETLEGPSRVHLDARRRGDRLELCVKNSPAAPEPTPGNGVGLANTRERLGLLFGEPADLETAEEDGAFVVHLSMPAEDSP